MLTLFVMPSGEPSADIDKTIESFGDMPIQLVRIDDWTQINRTCDNYWKGVFWDNERLSVDLAEALPYYFCNLTYDCLLCYKFIDEETASYRMRFFRNHVYLLEDFKPVGMFMKVEKILDGFVKSHENLRLIHR